VSDRWRPPGSEVPRAPAPRVATGPSTLIRPDREPLLSATDVVRTYRGANGVQAVRGASLSLAPKDFVALMGPSGSGKTTFLGLMSGLDAPDKGEVRWKGRLIRELSFDEQIELRRNGMGFVFQSFGLLPTLSAIENVELPLRVSGVALKDSRARAETWLARLGLADRLHSSPSPRSCSPTSRSPRSTPRTRT
jgi:putative ABC transport system ATP-binding protein